MPVMVGGEAVNLPTSPEGGGLGILSPSAKTHLPLDHDASSLLHPTDISAPSCDSCQHIDF